jgi:TRAP-type C4-dicarboxylate transport system substrate-binding protein
MNQTRKIRWLIAHEPVELFLRTANAFAEKLAELTNNEYEVEIFTASEYEAKVKNDKRATVFDKVSAQNHGRHDSDPMIAMEMGDLEMSQLHITELARWHSPEFFALELPFLFRDHDHAARVLEGDIGRSMLTNLKDHSPAQGLAFTYSGGFRVVISEEPVASIKDLDGITFATSINPVTIDTVESVGAVPQPFHIRDFIQKSHAEGFDSSALETTIPRYLAGFKDSTKKYIINTKHSLFLTSIIISNTFWASLDTDTQAKFQEACIYASRLERKWSVEEAEEFAGESDKHDALGITYSELSAEDTEKFKQLVQPVYDKYTEFFAPGLVDGIIRS